MLKNIFFLKNIVGQKIEEQIRRKNIKIERLHFQIIGEN